MIGPLAFGTKVVAGQIFKLASQLQRRQPQKVLGRRRDYFGQTSMKANGGLLTNIVGLLPAGNPRVIAQHSLREDGKPV